MTHRGAKTTNTVFIRDSEFCRVPFLYALAVSVVSCRVNDCSQIGKQCKVDPLCKLASKANLYRFCLLPLVGARPNPQNICKADGDADLSPLLFATTFLRQHATIDRGILFNKSCEELNLCRVHFVKVHSKLPA